MRTFISTLILSLSTCASAHAALYEFRLTGEVTYLLFNIEGVQIGDRATIRYVVDSRDANPDPMGGFYAATGATILFPTLTIVTQDSANLGVALNDTGVDTIQYLRAGQGFGLDVSFKFPDGTLPSDAIPLALPLHSSIRRSFSVFQSSHDLYRGTITSYSSVEVPEPAVVGLTLLLMICGVRRQFHD